MGRLVGRAGRGGDGPLSVAIRSALSGLVFFCGPAALVAAAVSVRTAGVVESWDTVSRRLLRHAESARVAASAERVPLDLLLAVASVESAGRADARSPRDAVGLMQLLPSTAEEVAADDGRSAPDLTDPATSLRLGARYLRRQLDAFDGRTALALCAYNAGPGAVRRWISDEAPPATPRSGAGDDAEVLGSWIPYGETREFVRRVFDWRARWRDALPR